MSAPEPEPEELVPDADGLVRRSWAVEGAALSALEGGSEDLRGHVPSQEETIVLLHGIPAGAELWRGVAARLVAAGHHVVAFDLPGYGQTLLPARGDHSLAGAAELVASWLRVHMGRPAWLVGHDLGGGVAQILASRYPTLLSRMTLADTVVEDSWPVTPVRLMQATARTGLFPLLGALRLLPNPFVAREIRRGFADPAQASPDVVERIFYDGKFHDDTGRRAFARHLLALDPSQTATAAGNLGRLPMPTQLVWGSEDAFQPWEGSGLRLQEALDGPAVTLLEGAGHFSPVERPDDFARALLEWAP